MAEVRSTSASGLQTKTQSTWQYEIDVDGDDIGLILPTILRKMISASTQAASFLIS